MRIASCALCLSLVGCQKITNEVAGAAADAVLDAAIPPLLDAFKDTVAKLFTHTAASRAAIGMSCGSHNVCRQETPLAEDACEAEANTWQPDFREAFQACLLEGTEAQKCFDIAVAAHEPTRDQTVLGDRCKGTILSCGVESDACDALTVLADNSIVDAIGECRSRGCQASLSASRARSSARWMTRRALSATRPTPPRAKGYPTSPIARVSLFCSRADPRAFRCFARARTRALRRTASREQTHPSGVRTHPVERRAILVRVCQRCARGLLESPGVAAVPAHVRVGHERAVHERLEACNLAILV